jgi:hypothetical protein
MFRFNVYAYDDKAAWSDNRFWAAFRCGVTPFCPVLFRSPHQPRSPSAFLCPRRIPDAAPLRTASRPERINTCAGGQVIEAQIFDDPDNAPEPRKEPACRIIPHRRPATASAGTTGPGRRLRDNGQIRCA